MLTDRDRATLDIAGRTWRGRGGRAEAVRVELGMTETEYALALNRLLDDPAAWEYAPGVVARLRRLRDQRMAARGRLAAPGAVPDGPSSDRRK